MLVHSLERGEGGRREEGERRRGRRGCHGDTIDRMESSDVIYEKWWWWSVK